MGKGSIVVFYKYILLLKGINYENKCWKEYNKYFCGIKENMFLFIKYMCIFMSMCVYVSMCK